MSFTIQLFAGPKEIIGSSTLVINLSSFLSFSSSIFSGNSLSSNNTVISSSLSVVEVQPSTETIPFQQQILISITLLRQYLRTQFPSLVSILPSCRFALDHEFVDNEDNTFIDIRYTCTNPHPTDYTILQISVKEIALIPPVSGG